MNEGIKKHLIQFERTMIILLTNIQIFLSRKMHFLHL